VGAGRRRQIDAVTVSRWRLFAARKTRTDDEPPCCGRVAWNGWYNPLFSLQSDRNALQHKNGRQDGCARTRSGEPAGARWRASWRAA
jgi:hypothetical protein